MKSDLTKFSRSSLVMRLERNQNDLLQMKSILSSYLCEPRTPSLFERCESLKHSLENLSNSNGEVIYLLKGHKQSVGKYLDRAKEQFQEFYLLQKGIEDYVAGVRKH